MKKNLPLSQSLVAKSLIPLLLLTCWSVAMVVARVWYFQASYYVFLIWNVFLAWIPIVISSFLFWWSVQKKKPIQARYLALPIFFWLIFLPNAPYLITDFVHLRSRNGVPIWYDVLLLLSFALLGLFQFEYSLIHVRELLRKTLQQAVSRWFVPVILLLMSIGIYLGRFLRWNSWEIFTQPKYLLVELYQLFSVPYLVFNAIVYITATTVVLALFHFLLHSIKDILNHD